MEHTKVNPTSEFDSVSKALNQLKKGETDLDIVCNQIILLAEQVRWKTVRQWLEDQFENDNISSHDFRAIMDILKGIMIEDTGNIDVTLVNPQQSLPTIHLPTVAEPDNYPTQMSTSLPLGRPKEPEETEISLKDTDDAPSLTPSIIFGVFSIIVILAVTAFFSRNHLDQFFSTPVNQPTGDVQNFDTQVSSPRQDPTTQAIPATQFEPESNSTITLPNNPNQSANNEVDHQEPSSEFEAITTSDLVGELKAGLENNITPENAQLLTSMFYDLDNRNEVAEDVKLLRQQLSNLLLEKAQEARSSNRTSEAEIYVELALNVKTHRPN